MPRQVAGLAALLSLAALGAMGCRGTPEADGSPKPSPRGQLLGLATTASIGPTGGTITSPDGRLTVTVPPGALPGAVNVTLDQITDTAPGKIDDVAYRIGPADTILLAPVTLAFRAAAPGASLDAFTVAYQENQGFWLRLREVQRTPADGTLTVSTTHFGDWSIVTRSAADLNGQITFQSTIGIPFSATGLATLNVAGADASGTWYLQWGTLALDSATLTSGAATCTASPATVELDTDIAEVMVDPTRFRWGTTARWPLTCSAGGGAAYSDLASLFFDTMGIYRPDCSRGYVQAPVITADRVQGAYTIDCGTAGAVTATWDFGTCTPGVACAMACHDAVISCDTGFPVCTSTGTLPDGTVCGTNQVCSGGACVSCTAGLACTTQPDPLCHDGVTSCATGASQCVNGTAKANGTSCGSNLVCNGGACVSCASGLACTTQPDPLCHSGVTSCATGTWQCVNGTAFANGTPCGPDQVCSGGACVSCAAGLACTTQPDPLCHDGVTSCATGTSQCVNGAAKTNGTSCGTDQVCNGGTCSACTADLVCTPANPCHDGRTSCSTGTQTCTDLGTNLPNGTSCGAGLTCNDGGCVPSRNVVGTRLVTYWPDGAPGAPVPAPDVIAPPLALVAALVPRAGGGFDTYTGTIDASGNVAIANVPAGPYLLSFVDGNGAHTFLETSSSSIDLGYDLLGRADAALATASTLVTFELTGLTPWKDGDEIQIASSNGDVLDAPTRIAPIAAGATSASLVDDWLASALGPAMNLLAPADVLWIHDLATLSTTQTSGSTTYPYLSASAAASVTGLAFASGTPSTVPAALGPPAQTGWVTGDAATGIDWRLSEFEAQLPALTGLAAMPPGSGHVLLVGAAARALANPAPIASGNPTLFLLALDAGTGDFATSASLPYGSFLEASTWSEWRGIEFSVPVAYLLPAASAAFTDRAALGRREAMSAGLPTPIVPTLLPVQAPALNGLDAFAPMTGAGTTPTLSWSPPQAPSLAPTSYTVELVLLGTSGTSTVATRIALWRVASTAVTVPAGLLAAGGTYYARITANWSSPDPLVTKPLSGEYVTAYATTLTAPFSP
ncbi:MAG TPA: hypothetical protein VIV57_01690 [Anaeromyxobacter sp.]